MNTPHHIDDNGEARMVDVGDKASTQRRAVARAELRLSAEAFSVLVSGDSPKGDVLAAARIAGIMAAKKTSELIPLCHQIALNSVTVHLEPKPAHNSIEIVSTVSATDQTGVEMEALTAVSIAGLTIYDMMKSFDKGMVISAIELVEKEGGRSGHYTRRVRVVEKSEPIEIAQAETKSNPPSSQPNQTEEPRALLSPMTRPGERPRVPTPPPPVPHADSIARAKFVRSIESDDLELEAFLIRDPITSAYMLGDLAKPYAEHCRWYGLDEEGLKAVLLLYEGLSMPALLTKGDPTDVESLLEAAHGDLPRRFYCHIRPEHKRGLECYFELSALKDMTRMGLKKKDYVKAGGTDDVEVLTHRDTAEIMLLYQHYPDNFFEPALLDTNLYFGIRHDGELISVAGIHVLSEKFNIAAIGNIVTHADHRGGGYASRCVRVLLDALFEKVDNVALNVRTDNEPAIACYAKFGFGKHYPFLEGWSHAR